MFSGGKGHFWVLKGAWGCPFCILFSFSLFLGASETLFLNVNFLVFFLLFLRKTFITWNRLLQCRNLECGVIEWKTNMLLSDHRGFAASLELLLLFPLSINLR